jgi:hypothetical protein
MNQALTKLNSLDKSQNLHEILVQLQILESHFPKEQMMEIMNILVDYEITNCFEKLISNEFVGSELMNVHLGLCLVIGKNFKNLFVKMRQVDWIYKLIDIIKRVENDDFCIDLLVEIIRIEELSLQEIELFSNEFIELLIVRKSIILILSIAKYKIDLEDLLLKADLCEMFLVTINRLKDSELQYFASQLLFGILSKNNHYFYSNDAKVLLDIISRDVTRLDESRTILSYLDLILLIIRKGIAPVSKSVTEMTITLLECNLNGFINKKTKEIIKYCKIDKIENIY